MKLRPLLTAAALAALAAAPGGALAKSPSGSKVAEEMRDPVNQAVMSGAVRALSEALLDIKLAPFVKAIEAAHGNDPRDIDPDMTLRDYAGPEAERMPYEMSRRLPALMDATGEMAGAFEASLPALKAMAIEMRDRVKDAGRR